LAWPRSYQPAVASRKSACEHGQRRHDPVPQLAKKARFHTPTKRCIVAAGLAIVAAVAGHRQGFVFVGLEDETGRLDVIVTPKLYEKEREIINGSEIQAVRGRLGKEDGVVNLKAETFFPLRLDQASQVVRSHDCH
jgi:DNA polymerase III alpha subunit